MLSYTSREIFVSATTETTVHESHKANPIQDTVYYENQESRRQ